MAKRCEICDKGPVVGRTVSHAHNVGPRRFEPNLQTVRALVNGATRRIRAGAKVKPPKGAKQPPPGDGDPEPEPKSIAARIFG